MANPLKVLTDLIVSGSTSTSGSLTVGGNGGLTVSAGTSAVQALTATTISASSTLQIGGVSTLAGAVTAQNGVTVTGAALNASAVAVSASALSVTNNAAVGGNLTVTGDLTVNGTTTTVNTQNLLIEDAIIQLGSSSVGNASADGDRGFVFSLSGSDNKAFFWDASDSKFKLANTTTTGGSSAIVPGTAQDLDVGTLTAISVTGSAGVNVPAGQAFSIGTVNAINTDSVPHPLVPGGPHSAIVLSYDGQDQGSYVAVASSSMGTYVSLSSSLQTLIRGTGIAGTAGGVALEGGIGGVEILANGTNVEDIKLFSAAGGIKIQTNSTDGAHSITLSTTGNSVSGTVVQGKLHVEDNNGTYSNFTLVGGKLGGQYTNITGAFAAIDAALGSVMGGATVTPTEYYSLRTVVKGVKQAGNDTVVFTISGSANASESGRTPSGRGLTSMSSSNADTLVSSLMAGMSFDIATKVPNTGLWSNDLVSVQLTASSLENNFYWPQIIVDAPALATNSEIRLIVVNENNGVII